MKLARFTTPDRRPAFGVVTDEHAIALDHRVKSFAALLANPASRNVSPDDPRWPLADVGWEPPLEPTSKVVCVGLSFGEHAKEVLRKPADQSMGRGFTIEPHLPLFGRFPDSFVGHRAAVERPFDSDTLDWEGEAAMVIGRAGRRISAERAFDHLAGFTVMAENSVRAWQAHSTQATAGKNWFHSGALGPWVATVDEVGTEPLSITTLLNGEKVQSDTTEGLAVPIAEMISYISTLTPLRPGDVIATGTPAGVGYRWDPPRYLRPGDELTVEVSRVGVLSHTVVDEKPNGGL